MSAVVCGKRSFFEEIHTPLQKRLRCAGGNNSVHAALSRADSEYPSCTPSVDRAEFLSQLKTIFPDMGEQLIEKVLASNRDNLDFAIKSLHELRLSSDGGNSSCLSSDTTSRLHGAGSLSVSINSSTRDNVKLCSPWEGTKWVELFVQEMANAVSLDDAREQTARALEMFEKEIVSSSGFSTEKLQQENTLLKEQLQSVVRENHILKRAVSIQHERQVEHENCLQEMQQLKQSITRYQEQIRSLELTSYALTLHLQRAQEGISIHGRFHPDVY